MSLCDKIKAGKFILTSEIGPPKGIDIEEMLKDAELIKGKVDAINVTDLQSSVMRIGSLAICKLLIERGMEPVFQITGTGWPTRDGTGIRDYIHVWDLAEAHVKAVENFDQALARSGVERPYLLINLGTGRGVTVRQLVAAFEGVYGRAVAKEEVPPRPGDVAGAFANADLAKKLIGWEAVLPIEQGIADALRWGEVRASVLGVG